MPELPEVESLVRRLRPQLEGKTITAVDVRWNRTIDRPKPKEFTRVLTGATITRCARRGKFLTFELRCADHEQRTWYVHLRMSGSLIVEAGHSLPQLHDRVVLSLSSRKKLRFHDPRKFGRMYCVSDPLSVVKHLGPEPFDQALVDSFPERLRGRRGAVKSLLLKQDFLAGVGNIYADEALWHAGIHPQRSADRISPPRATELLKAIIRCLTAAIDAQGTDFGDHVVVGDYVPNVYGRTGKPCHRCRTPIKRIVVGQRGTHFCPKCQR